MPSLEFRHEAEAAEKLLASGAWIGGHLVISAITSAVSPQRASRLGYEAVRRKAVGAVPPWGSGQAAADEMRESEEGKSKLIEVGRLYRARRMIQQRCGSYPTPQWESDPPSLTFDHYRGLLPFRLRLAYEPDDRLSTCAVAEHIDVRESVVRGWIANEYVPPPEYDELGVIRIPPDQLRYYEWLKAIYRPRKRRWAVPPSVLWGELATCPSCGTVREWTVEDLERRREELTRRENAGELPT